MTVSKHGLEAVLNVGLGHTLSVIDAKITLDDGWSPYIQVELTCWTPAEAVLDLLDPRDSRRVVLTVTKEFGDWNPSGIYTDQERVLNLLLRAREVDHNTGTMTVTLESDEALLQDFGLVATAPERIYGLSVKDAVVYALAKIGALLEAGAADADIVSDPLPAVVTNLSTNPSFELNTTGWATGGNVTGTGTVTRPTAGGLFGAAFMRWTATSTAAAAAAGGLANGVFRDITGYNAGVKVNTSAWVRTSKVTAMAFAIEWRSATAALRVDIGDPVVMVANTWTRLLLPRATPPEGTTIARFKIYSINIPGYSAWVSGNTLDVDGILTVEGDTLLDYFDGSTPDDGLFDYAWTGTAHASTSTRTALPNSDAMIWRPGVTAWDWLEPLLQATGLRLYCTEARQWILEAAGTPVDGQLNLAEGVNVTQAGDTISHTEAWYDSVVIAYSRNEDADGKTTTIYDAAGAPGTKMLRLEYDRAYPGPGAAQAILDRAQGRGRVLALESISDYTATPGMALSATLPDSPVQAGVISSVAWSFPDNRMTIGSRGLVDTPASSWLFATTGRRWQDIPVGTDWTEYTP